MNANNLKKTPLGLPLVFAAVGTIASLRAGRNTHAAFGATWTLLSLLHGWQHLGKMKKDATKILPCEKNSPLKNFLRGIKIVAFTEGRLRVRHDAFVGNESLARQAKEYVESFTGVTKASVNTLTGSLLVEYDPQKLRSKKGLLKLEAKISAKTRR